MKIGSTSWLDSPAEVMRRCESQCSSLWSRISSTSRSKIASPFFDPLIESWDIDLATFGMEIVLNRRLAPGHPKKFGFVELEHASPVDEEPGLRAFLQDPSLRGDATAEEIEFLKKLKFRRERPTPLYYYRELQNLRDPLHFRRVSSGAGDGVDTVGSWAESFSLSLFGSAH